tara:strand:+ start:86 stop:382 length:297 start_codon:yes stop_codon:yes gene_type:complete
MYYVYALSSLRRNYIYVGMTSDVKRRMTEHNVGKEKTTRPYLPFRLLYIESCENRIESRKREKYWKSGTYKICHRNIQQPTATFIKSNANANTNARTK